MSTETINSKSPARQKLIKRYGIKKVDWKKYFHSKDFKPLKLRLNAAELREKAWKTGSSYY